MPPAISAEGKDTNSMSAMGAATAAAVVKRATSAAKSAIVSSSAHRAVVAAVKVLAISSKAHPAAASDPIVASRTMRTMGREWTKGESEPDNQHRTGSQEDRQIWKHKQRNNIRTNTQINYSHDGAEQCSCNQFFLFFLFLSIACQRNPCCSNIHLCTVVSYTVYC